MAEALVSVLLEQLALITVQEAKQSISLVVGVDEEVRKLEYNLRIIHAVLENAEKRQVTVAAVKLWLEKFKDTSYNMDDVLDEWNTALIKQRIQEEEKEEEIAENAHVLKKANFQTWIYFEEGQQKSLLYHFITIAKLAYGMTQERSMKNEVKLKSRRKALRDNPTVVEGFAVVNLKKQSY